jgi:dihydrodipicolinate synthase/N-acetylneuraminate lyase
MIPLNLKFTDQPAFLPMDTRPITSERLSASVIAVPPLARHGDLTLNRNENTRLIRFLESGGINCLLYGGNANFYHLALSEYESTLAFLSEIAADDTLVIPSAGPAYGTMMDQAAILRNTDFPTVMALPQQGMTTSNGVITGIRHFAEALGRPVVLYLKYESYLNPRGAAALVDEGLVSWIKYAVVRENPSHDPYLTELVNLVDPKLIVSGMGEQPAITHMRDFGFAGFTSGCVCANPALSQKMLVAIRNNNFDIAEKIRDTFQPLENLRNTINPVRVLHDAVTLADIADMGPALPLMSNLEPELQAEVKATTSALLESR